MLQKAADEFIGPQYAGAGFSTVGIFVGKGDLAVRKSADASVAQCHAKYVGSQILERRHTCDGRKCSSVQGNAPENTLSDMITVLKS